MELIKIIEIINIIILSYKNNLLVYNILGFYQLIVLSNNYYITKKYCEFIILVNLSSSIMCYIINKLFFIYINIINIDIQYMNIIIFLLIIAVTSYSLYYLLKLNKFIKGYLLLFNIFILSINITLTSNKIFIDLRRVVFYSLFSSLFYIIYILIFTSLRHKINNNHIEKLFKGMPILFFLACIISIAFYGFMNLKIVS